MHPYERLGAFYLGRLTDPETGETRPDLLLYDSRDLVTHAVILGMTGSGKTGLGITLLEEAALDGIPSLVIDPKGDLGNLLLTFPGLEPADFEPWIDPAEAARHEHTPAEEAAAVARTWREGLAAWDEPPERIARFRKAAEVAIYTPGSRSGLPLSLLGSFAPPPAASAADPDARGDRIEGVVSGLLALLGIAADPLQSREHILIANLIDHAWSAGHAPDVASLVREIQRPPFTQLGALALEAFYAARDRAALAARVNGLLAAPGGQVCSKGIRPIRLGSCGPRTAGRGSPSCRSHISPMPSACSR